MIILNSTKIRKKAYNLCVKVSNFGAFLEAVMEKQILVIDDEPISIRIIKNFLKDEFKVNAVTDGSAAMKYLSKYKPDVILLDYMMPIYDGAHLFEMIQKNKKYEDIPVIVVTGVRDEEKIMDIISRGAKYIIKKPVEKRELLDMINKVLET